METSLPLIAFVVAATVTPGPNNLMVLASGANWGLARTLPHVLGIVIGFPVMILAVGLGLSVVFEAAPWLHSVLKYVAFAYLCWLAWRIATAARPGENGGIRRPLNLWQAAAFQWVNPKAWTMILSGMAVFVDPAGNRLLQVIGIAALFALVVPAQLPRMGGVRPRNRPFPVERRPPALVQYRHGAAARRLGLAGALLNRRGGQPMQRAGLPNTMAGRKFDAQGGEV